MSVFGEGECLYGLFEVCRLGDEGIKVDPIYCLNCTILKLGEVIEEALTQMILPSESDNPTQSDLH